MLLKYRYKHEDINMHSRRAGYKRKCEMKPVGGVSVRH